MADPRATLAATFRRLTGHAEWQRVSARPLRFDAYHPQGLAKVGDALFVSSVEVTVAPRPYPSPRGGFDRDPGSGAGHLFKIDLDGGALGRITLGERAAYHPGGIDGDGAGLWVPVAEYRPGGGTIVYRVDPATLAATEAFRFPDHIGAVAYDAEAGVLHGFGWGSRRLYAWRLRSDGGDRPPAEAWRRSNPSHYVDYQDCQHVGGGLAVCSGVQTYRPIPNRPELLLGGMELVDLAAGRPVHQIPVRLWTEAGLPLTRNPVWTERQGKGLRVYFLPEDGAAARLFVYDVAPEPRAAAAHFPDSP